MASQKKQPKTAIQKYKEQWQKLYEIPNEFTATKEDYIKAIHRAAKAANQRLVRLEKDSSDVLYRNYAYGNAMEYINERIAKTGKSGKRKLRFEENPKYMTLQQLKREYRMIREFYLSPTSTAQGISEMHMKRYKTAVERGYTGTFDEFQLSVTKVFTKYAEALFDSTILYQAVTGGKVDIIEEIVNEQMAIGVADRGRALIRYLDLME